MKVVVTGSSGFIGTHLVKALVEEGHDVVGLDIAEPKHGIPTLALDIRTPHLLHTGGVQDVDAIIHLAAIAAPREAEEKPELAWATNVQGTHNVLLAARHLEVQKVVFFSSAHVYGISPKYLPTDENHPLALHDTYTTTKIMGEQLCELFYRNYGISYTTLRLFNGYGPGQSPDYFIGKKMREAAAGKVELKWNPDVTKDWVHVSDIVRAAQQAVSSVYVGPINIGTGVETRLRDIASLLAERYGAELEIGDDTEGPTRMSCDWTRAEKVLGWRPRVSFAEGLASLVERAP